MNGRTRLRQAIAHTVAALEAVGYVVPLDLHTDDFSYHVEQFEDRHESIMLAFYVPYAIAQKIYIDGGEDKQDLHITLALVGKVDDYSKSQIAKLDKIIRAFSEIHPPLNGVITGPAAFAPNQSKRPFVLLVDIPGLPAWRQRLVEILALNGYQTNGEHGYIPHITVKYAEVPGVFDFSKLDSLEFPIDISLASISLGVGEKRKDYKLSGNDIPEGLESFAALRGTGTPGRKPAAITAVNAYQEKLQRIYSDWADDLADDLADADSSEHDDIIKKALAALLLLLRNAGRTALPDAVTLGLNGDPHNPDVLKILTDAMEANDDYIEDSLVPDIEAKLKEGLSGQDILEAIAAGSGAAAIGGLLATLTGRVESYANPFWNLYNQSVGETAKERGYGVRWVLDEGASHCKDCSEFGDRDYDSYDDLLSETGGLTPGNPDLEDAGNCRCRLEFTEE